MSGRQVGRDLETVCGAIEKDSTYGSMHRFLFGVDAEPCVRIVDREKRLLEVAGFRSPSCRPNRNPRDIGWREHGVRVVVDTTGAFGDPTHSRMKTTRRARFAGTSAAGAEAVINSAAFKIKDKALSMPDDAITLIYGCNHELFDPGAPPRDLGGLVHDHRAGPHGQAPARPPPRLDHHDGVHEHGTRGDEQPGPARHGAQGRGRRIFVATAARSTASFSPRATPPMRWKR